MSTILIAGKNGVEATQKHDCIVRTTNGSYRMGPREAGLRSFQRQGRTEKQRGLEDISAEFFEISESRLREDAGDTSMQFWETRKASFFVHCRLPIGKGGSLMVDLAKCAVQVRLGESAVKLWG